MVKTDFLSSLGLFVIKDFIEPERCSALRKVIAGTTAKRARVVDKGQQVLDEETRRTYDHFVDDETRSQMHSQLQSVIPQLEKHFDVKLSGCVPPRFLVYHIGDFFLRHPDNTMQPDLPESIKNRKVSVIVFLNDNDEEGTQSETFSGGTLNFYGLLPDARLKNRSIPLKCKEGLLVAFRSDLHHEVRPVTRGERYSVVTWFF
jgi:SM-20-related protein